MMEFGKSLKTARDAKGYSVAQLAELTHLAPSVIENLEGEDFSHIPAPIYGRGFVKLYCEAVSLEPKPFIDEFMEIMNGNREPHIRERVPVADGTAKPSEPIAEPEIPSVVPQETVPEAEPTDPPQQDLFSRPLGAAEPECPPEVTRPEPAAPADGPALSRYATPFRDDERPRITSATWRLGALALAGLAILFLLALGIRSLYRTTMPAKADAPEPVAEQPRQPTQTAAAPRTPQDIPALYLY